MAAVRMTFTLDSDTAQSLAVISTRLGVSRSGLVNELLAGACVSMLPIIDTMPTPSENGTETDLIRLRGDSRAVLQSRVRELEAKVNAL